ncbi:transcription antitermination factor NusB, partial [Candidatus Woesearchaeota archaeon]|nr:transcription antitermination factor NusB [Candidatus Woesearchaeota archaeon]
AALQALYQWQLTRDDLSEIERQFLEEREMNKVDLAYFQELLHRIPAELDRIDAVVLEFAERKLSELDPVERAIARISAYELLYRPEIPYRVVINEGINLSKTFGAAESHKYVNSLLDRIARKTRSLEINRPAFPGYGSA